MSLETVISVNVTNSIYKPLQSCVKVEAGAAAGCSLQVSPELQCEEAAAQVEPQQLVPSFVSGFLESFEELRAQEKEKMTQCQENIVSLLEHCSRVRSRGRAADRREGM